MNAFCQARLPVASMSEPRAAQDSNWSGFTRAVPTWQTTVIVGMLVGFVIAVGWIDYLTGVELSVSLLCLIPIMLGTGLAGSCSIGVNNPSQRSYNHATRHSRLIYEIKSIRENYSRRCQYG